jgi:hypothetical protein
MSAEPVSLFPDEGPMMRKCEGSRNLAERLNSGTGACRVCGQRFTVDRNWCVPKHDRDDMLARIGRGDFG